MSCLGKTSAFHICQAAVSGFLDEQPVRPFESDVIDGSHRVAYEQFQVAKAHHIRQDNPLANDARRGYLAGKRVHDERPAATVCLGIFETNNVSG